MASSLLVWSVFQSSRNLLHLHVEVVNDRRYQEQNNQSTEPLLLIQFEYPAPHLPQTLQKDKLLQGCDIYESQHSVLRINAINIDLVELFCNYIGNYCQDIITSLYLLVTFTWKFCCIICLRNNSV